MKLPLSDIRVVDFCQVFAGPATTLLLADQGAEVIKVETPEGDNGRRFMPIPGSDGLSPGYMALNRNKRNIVLDLTTSKGREVAYRLVRWADVAVCNLRVSVPQRLGIAYEDLAPINPRLVYASITAYGEKGPDATLPGYDLVVQAKSGITATRRLPDGTPQGSSIFYADMAGAMLAAYAIMVALHERETTGRGQKVEVNLLHVYLALQAVQMVKTTAGSQPGPGRRPSALATPYRASDDRFIHVHAASERQWVNLCRALELDHLLDDPAFATGEKRYQQAEVLYDILTNLIATRPAREWETILKARNCPTSVIQEWAEVWEDPQMLANNMFTQLDQPGLGPVTMVDVPIRLSGSGDNPRSHRPSSGMGEHNTEILHELGYGESEIKEMEKDGILGRKA
ncbi:MAG: CoA transferase [Dehalococcoidia bacterium]